ncbi:hypothetical protein GQX74_001759 [Glossina fuscipes]|nr:hypothetical protein GQX74_001759 [Glossina fuscipes]
MNSVTSVLTNIINMTIIREMNRLGMMVDLSHVSTGTMRDALEVSEAPVIFSHSSAYELCNSSRNVQDDMLQSLARNGGLIMVNFYSRFLSCSENSTVHDAVAHINHIKRVAGIDHVGLGAGYDGINLFNDCNILKGEQQEEENEKLEPSKSVLKCKELKIN